MVKSKSLGPQASRFCNKRGELLQRGQAKRGKSRSISHLNVADLQGRTVRLREIHKRSLHMQEHLGPRHFLFITLNFLTRDLTDRLIQNPHFTIEDTEAQRSGRWPQASHW